MSNAVLSLSRKGTLTDAFEKADRLIAYYLTSNISQSMIYNGNVLSFQGAIQEYGNGDALSLQNRITADLNTLLGSAFDSVQANVVVSTPAQDGSDRYNIQIAAVVTQNGTAYNLPQLLFSSNDGIVANLLTLNNG